MENRTNAYQRNAILTASPAALTLMLYEGAIKFCNIAIVGIEHKDYEKANTNLQITLDHKYPVWEDFDRVYQYIYDCLTDANIQKSIELVEEALKHIREMRDTWKEVMQKAGAK